MNALKIVKDCDVPPTETDFSDPPAMDEVPPIQSDGQPATDAAWDAPAYTLSRRQIDELVRLEEDLAKLTLRLNQAVNLLGRR